MIRVIVNFLDFFRPATPEVLACYQNKMPDSIHVDVNRDRGKVWAEISGFGNDDILYTEAKDSADLEERVNDAVVTYYEVPYRYAKYILVNKRYYNPGLAKKKQRSLKSA